MIVILLIGYCYSSSVDIPFVFNWRGHAIFQTRMPQFFGDESLPARFMINSDTYCYFELPSLAYHRAERSMGIEASMIVESLRFSVPNIALYLLSSARMRELEGEQVDYGIDRLNLFGGDSVDFIRSGMIRVNSSTDSFISNFCDAPDHVIHLNRFAMHSQRSYLIETEFSFEGYDDPPLMAVVLVAGGSDFIVELPPDMYTHLMRLTNAFADRPFQPHRIANCTDQLIANLPNIDLRFINSPGANASLVRLYPEDYIRRTDNDTCELLVDPSEGPALARFDPLMLPNVNVRLESQSLYLCDF